MRMATVEFFESIIRAVNAGSPGFKSDVWPELRPEQVGFLEQCPLNKNGWYWYQIPAGPVIQYKTGMDFRTARPFHIVKVGGLDVVAFIGHYRSTEEYVLVGMRRGRFFAYSQGKTVYMSPHWEPCREALLLYRRLMDRQRRFNIPPATREEKMILWAASLLSNGEEYLRQRIQLASIDRKKVVEAYYRELVGPIRLRVIELM
jgi:hypothetical protein